MNFKKSLFSVNESAKIDDKYTTAVNVPQYLPKSICPNVVELCDIKKYSELIAEINKSNVPDEVKKIFKISCYSSHCFSV